MRIPPPSSPSKTFGAIMASGRTTGFDYLRLILATGIFCSHSIDVSYGVRFTVAFENGAIRPLIALLLPMFFALSGFLVAGSLDRCRSLISFMGLRVIRLAPALAFETVVAALILGPMLTRLPLAAYFGDSLLVRYFLNIVGDIQYLLPGMFEDNPWPRTVNAQLWTLPYELMCYIVLATLALFGLHRHRKLFALVVLILNIGLTIHYAWTAAGAGWNPLPVAPGPSLVLAFLYGISFYLYRDAIPYSPRVGVASGVLAMALLAHSSTDYLAPLFAAYFTVWLGLMRPRSSPLTRHGDYSYGIFLFGFPIQQAMTQVMAPQFQQWFWNVAAALPLTILFAVISWHSVEKPALALRGPLRRLEDQVLGKQRANANEPNESRI